MDFKNELPTESGWYLVKWEPKDVPMLVYVHAGFEPGFISWGFDETDDPEGLTDEKVREDGTLWKIATKDEIEKLKI